jgi:cis-L-3-hydroxyproline dehydratase
VASTPTIHGRALVQGRAAGPVLFADLGLSFMGGVDPATGVVIDTHHPLQGRSVAGMVLAIPSGRGSCSGSLLIFELLLNGHAPRALVFHHKETILTLGVVIAHELFERGIPVLHVAGDDFASLADARFVTVDGDRLIVSNDEPVELSERDHRMLAGEFGEAAAIALRIVVRTALLEGAAQLVDVELAHIDGCFYHGPASMRFARRLLDAGARVSIPTTTNAICVDRRQWRELGVEEEFALVST